MAKAILNFHFDYLKASLTLPLWYITIGSFFCWATLHTINQILKTCCSYALGKYALINITTPDSVFFVLKIIRGKMHLFPSCQQSCSEPQPDLATSAHLCVLAFLEKKTNNYIRAAPDISDEKGNEKEEWEPFVCCSWGGGGLGRGVGGSSLGQWALRWEASQSVFHGSSHLILSALAIVHDIVKRGKMGSWLWSQSDIREKTNFWPIYIEWKRLFHQVLFYGYLLTVKAFYNNI